MRICFVGKGRLGTFAKEYSYAEEDLILFGFDGMGEVSYEKELKGESDFFEETARPKSLQKRRQHIGYP